MFAGNKWDVPDDNCYQMIDQVIKEFEKEYPNVTIKYESGVMKDDYSEWLSQKALKGDLPDVFMVLPEDFSIFSSVGMLQRLIKRSKKATIMKEVMMLEPIRERNMLFHTKVYQL